MKKFEEKIFVKKIRAKTKHLYYKLKEKECYICGKTDELELHHILPLAELVKRAIKENKEVTVDDVIKLSPEIFEKDNTATLCKTHHYYLHNLFGKTYNSKTAEKVKQYLENQRRKQYGKIH